MSAKSVTRAAPSSVVDISKKRRAVRFVGNDDSLDLHATVIDPHGIRTDVFSSNPCLLFEHGTSPLRSTIPVGRVEDIGVERYKGRPSLMATAIYAEDEFSESLFRCYEANIMRGFSVRIKPYVANPPTRDEVRARPDLADCALVYRDSELLELSCTGLPSNSHALAVAVSRGLTICRSIQGHLSRADAEPTMPAAPVWLKKIVGPDQLQWVLRDPARLAEWDRFQAAQRRFLADYEAKLTRMLPGLLARARAIVRRGV
jgi:hypothetical protein